MNRDKMCFDKDWLFYKGDAQGADKAAFDDSGWRGLNLPHDWSIEGPYDEKDPSGSGLGYLPGGIGWYRKKFKTPADAASKTTYVVFDGVFRFSDVWINEHHLGFFPDGYTPFDYDLTPYLKADGSENVLAVRVDNSGQPNSRWYTGSGIYRHVWLVSTGKGRIVQDGVYITTPKIGQDEAAVFVQLEMANDWDDMRDIRVDCEIVDAGGKSIGKGYDYQRMFAGARGQFEITVETGPVHLWSDTDPYLYTAHFTVSEGGKQTDGLSQRFGFRTLEFTPDGGCVINGQSVKIKGVCIHHEMGHLGAAVPDKAWVRRFKVLKEMGCNGIRTSHNAPANELLDLCDEMGFLVMDECFDEWRQCRIKNYQRFTSGEELFKDTRFGTGEYWDEWSDKNLIAMLRRDRNHPSIVLWSIGNEIPEQAVTEGPAMARHLVDICHTYDPTRPTTTAAERVRSEIIGDAASEDFLNAVDVLGYNYVGRWGKRYRTFYSEDKLTHPDRCVIGSENPDVRSVRGVYNQDADANSRLTPYFNTMLQVEELWKFTKTYDYVAGDYIWTGIDYLGEAHWPNVKSSSGMIDTCTFPKDGFYFFQSQWSDEPMVKLIPHWNWEGKEGKPIYVVCYTNCESVELFLDDQSYGVQAYDYFREGMKKYFTHYDKPLRPTTTNDLHLLWIVPYQKGVLKAVAKNDGKVVCEDIVATAGKTAKLALELDAPVLKADGTDVAHVVVRALDKDGNFAPLAEERLQFKLEGGGELLALDNGNPTCHEIGNRASSFQLFSGMMIAYIQSGEKAGNLRLTVSGEGIESASVEIKVQ